MRPSEDTELEAQQRTERIATAGVVVEWEDILNETKVTWPNVCRTVIPAFVRTLLTRAMYSGS